MSSGRKQIILSVPGDLADEFREKESCTGKVLGLKPDHPMCKPESERPKRRIQELHNPHKGHCALSTAKLQKNPRQAKA